MQAVSSSQPSQAAQRPLRSCLKTSFAQKKATVRFALPPPEPRRPSLLLAAPQRLMRVDSGPRLASSWAEFDVIVQRVAKQLYLTCCLVGAYHTALQPSTARVTVFGLCFVLPAARALAKENPSSGTRNLQALQPHELMLAAVVTGAGLYVGLTAHRAH